MPRNKVSSFGRSLSLFVAHAGDPCYRPRRGHCRSYYTAASALDKNGQHTPAILALTQRATTRCAPHHLLGPHAKLPKRIGPCIGLTSYSGAHTVCAPSGPRWPDAHPSAAAVFHVIAIAQNSSSAIDQAQAACHNEGSLYNITSGQCQRIVSCGDAIPPTAMSSFRLSASCGSVSARRGS